MELCEMTDDVAAVELLADVEHERWSSWMRWLFKHGKWNKDATFTLDAEKAQRWRQLADTDYLDLDDHAQDYDRAEVRKTLAALAAAGYAVVKVGTAPTIPTETYSQRRAARRLASRQRGLEGETR